MSAVFEIQEQLLYNATALYFDGFETPCLHVFTKSYFLVSNIYLHKVPKRFKLNQSCGRICAKFAFIIFPGASKYAKTILYVGSLAVDYCHIFYRYVSRNNLTAGGSRVTQARPCT